MDPFFRSRWNAPSHPRYYSHGVRPVHVQSQTVHPPKPVSRTPKVVSIPVHFVEQEQERDRSGSVLKIQKVFRGFLVRKSVRKIAALRREVEEIERRVSDTDTVEVLRRDSKERLRVSEMLMSVLFRLDSVRGVDSGVRDYRKAVIRRAIALQEKVDEIVAVDLEAEKAANANRATEVEQRLDAGSETTEEVAQVDDSGAGELITGASEAACIASDGAKHLERSEADANCCGDGDQKMDDSMGDFEQLDGGDLNYTMIEDRLGREEAEMCMPDDEDRSAQVKGTGTAEIDGSGAGEMIRSAPELPEGISEDRAGDGAVEEPMPCPSMNECSEETQPESQTDSTSNPQSLIEAAVDDEEEEGTEEREFEGEKEDEEIGYGGGGRRNRRSKELMEKMVEDNEKMMGMLAELFERNERQTRLLSSLSQRVEQLERAYVCEKLRRKKKRHASTGCLAANCSEKTSPEPKKCGRK